MGIISMRKVDLAKTSLRELNQDLHRQTAGSNEGNWEIINSMGYHAVAVSVMLPSISISGVASDTTAPG